MTVTRNEFPADFAWGTATASYQVEGAVAEDGRTPSIWDTFVRIPGTVADGTVGDVAADHYHRFAGDVALMSELGVNAYRFSISWSRVLRPDGEPNPAGIDFYRRLLTAVVERGITPYATLYHWDLPQHLEDAGGWLSRDTADAFVRYVETAVGALGDLVGNWITLNEPWCSAFLGYASGHHAPGRRLGSESSHAVHHLLLAHGLAVAAIRRLQPDARLGISLNLYSIRPASDSAQDQDAARRIDGLQNRLFLEPVLQGHYPADVLADLGEQEWFADQPSADLEAINAPIDFLGINYYSRHTATAGTWDGSPSANPGSEFVEFVDTGAPKTQMGWPVHPDGIVDVLRQAGSYAPGLPLMITENGAAYPDQSGPDGFDDVERCDYIEQHIAACRDAVRDGLPLVGYFVWSLIDNFEWGWGFSRRFGIVHVDYESQQRTVKTSGRWYAAFLAGGN
ncbi:GH1 family beta-glucosidase [Microlunatus sp. Gsoil 973]|uniref:GH1 family beta-glucosidase n=1 Tax=Microlunatus sp. Gsoil 973 TaxID=2672569 RepID=UPI0012B4F5A7|nr:GH1 family beta-glucosidase [Microlunatus sp. Gsoil 973]QGN32073.1 beta-glucosidase [Microlunatus sp. Gsoil 973]